jgi:CheY-like chemotaxis protein
MKAMPTLSILVADDEANIRMMLRTALESDGYLVREARTGHEALNAIEQARPDLVLLDLNMPSIDGIAVLEELRTWPVGDRPRVVVLTAYGSIATAVKATRLGALDFLEKPITPEELRKAVRGAISEPELDRLAVAPILRDSYEAVLDKIRKSLRMAEFESAEALLMKAAGRRDQHSAEYFNLLGVLYEANGNWRLARKCYGKAMSADKHYEPALINVRRIYELNTFGRTAEIISLGDSLSDVVVSRPDEP